MSLHMFREINQWLPLLAFGWLMYRVVLSWPAQWARPDHVTHYRALLAVVSTYVLLSSLTAWWYEAAGADVGYISPAYTAQTVIVLALCWRWPKKMRS